MQFSQLLTLGGSHSAPGSSLTASLRQIYDGFLACLPAWLKRNFGLDRLDLLLEITETQVRAHLVRPTEAPESLGEWETTDTVALRDVLQRGAQARARIVLILPSPEVLVRKVPFPAQVQGHITRVLGYELDRLTPFQSQEIYHSVRILPERTEQSITVELAVVRRVVADEWLQRLRAAGGAADVMRWPGAWPMADLLPPDHRRETKHSGYWWRGFWVFLLLALAGAAGISPLLQQRAIVIDLIEQIDQAHAEAAKVAELRAQLEKEEKAGNFVVEQKRKAHYVVPLLARLTQLMPDHTWFNLFNYNEGQVDFSGDSKQATALIELLARDPAFHNITFRSPVMVVRGSEKERFHIQLDYSGIEEGN